MELSFLTANPIVREYEEKAVKSLEQHLNGYALCVEKTIELIGVNAGLEGIEEAKAILGSNAFTDAIAGAVQFESAIDMLKLMEPAKRYKRKHLLGYVGREVLRKGNLTESAMELWESNGAWALNRFRELGVDPPSWAHMYLNVPYPKS